MRHLFLAAAGLALAACATPAAGPPVEAQLATVCSSIATGYRTAAVIWAQGKLSQATVDMLISVEPTVTAACDPAHPPADLPGALAATTAVLEKITLANAGVK